jgi:predicted permease
LTGLFNLIFPFFGLIGLGYIAGRYFPREENGLVWLNRLLIYAALPALIFQVVRKAPVDKVLNIPFFLGTSLSTYLIFILTLGLMIVIYGASLRQAAIQGSTASYGNIGYIGLPLTLSVFGPEAAVPTILVFCFDNTMQYVLVPLLMALGSDGHKDVWLILKRIGRLVFLHPFIIATILGVAFVLTGLD